MNPTNEKYPKWKRIYCLKWALSISAVYSVYLFIVYMAGLNSSIAVGYAIPLLFFGYGSEFLLDLLLNTSHVHLPHQAYHAFVIVLGYMIFSFIGYGIGYWIVSFWEVNGFPKRIKRR